MARAASVLAILAMLLGAAGSPVAAQEISQTDYEPRVYLVTISEPDFHELELPKFKNLEEAQKYSGGLMLQRMQRTMNDLERLREAGLIQEAEMTGDGFFIQIKGVEPAAFPMIEKLETVGKILDDTGEENACLSNAANSLPERLYSLSQAQTIHEQNLATGGLDATPKIEIYTSSYEDYWNIYITATPNKEFKLEIWRNGALVAYEYKLSDPDGSLVFYPGYLSCPYEHTSWSLVSGDTVKIIGDGQTYQTVYAPITGWGNPDTNIITGSTLPGRTVRVTITQRDPAQPCNIMDYSKQGTADAAGNFSINMSSVVDFNQDVWDFYLESIDSSDHLTYTFGRMYGFYVYEGEPYFFIFHKPGMNFTAALKRNNIVISSVSGTTDEYGYADGQFSSPTLVGDVATLSIGGETFIRTVVTYSIPQVTSFDKTTGVLAGTGQPGQKIFVTTGDSSYVNTQCDNLGSDCLPATIPASGNFSFTVGPVERGTGVYLYAILPDGSLGGTRAYGEPVISAYPPSDYALIDDYYSEDPTVTLKTSGGVIKETVIAYFSYNFYGYRAYFSEDMIAGDIIEVTDGYRTDNMVVGNVGNLRLNYNTNHLTGQAAGSQIIARVSGSGGDNYRYCTSLDLGSKTSFDLAIPTVNADYYASVGLKGSDGHFTSGYSYSLDLNVWVNNTELRGYAETPGVTVNWELWRAGGKIDYGSTTLDPTSKWFYVWYTNEPVTGDEVRVTTSDGNSAKIVYPSITANADFSARTVSGKSIPNRLGSSNFYRHTPDGYSSYNVYWFADAGGNYLTHMPAEMYWSRDCSAVSVSPPCSPLGAYSWTVDNFWVINWPDWPESPIAADAFEVDNTKELAKAYSSIQSHTLHTDNDEDWVKFTVTQEDIDHNHEFLFRTYNLGWDFDLKMELRAPDGTTLIAEAGAESWNGLGPELQYSFATPGTYYLRLHSMGDSWDWDGGYCDSKYSLYIMKDPKFIYLPMIKR